MLKSIHSISSSGVRFIALLCCGIITSLLLSRCVSVTSSPVVASASICETIVSPLTSAEAENARIAWQYFLNNYQKKTGLVNAADRYPSTTLWDMGNYLTALNAAHCLGLADQQDFDYRLNQFLTTLGKLPLFEQALPNKVYDSSTGKMVDYNNKATERGIGWSAIDLGRLLTALHVIRVRYPQYAGWIEDIVSSWQLGRSVANGELYGAHLETNGKLARVQEGRLGYEEYAARGYQLWGFAADKAIKLDPYQLVDVEGVKIPVDQRDYKTTNGSNYVVSESYILEGVEFGLRGDLKKYAENVLNAQAQRYQKTGLLTAVSEDNIDRSPHFLYSTVYANGTPWAVITTENKPHANLRTWSTKAAFGWHYLYPEHAYAQKLLQPVEQVKDAKGGGFYAGIYETKKEPNDILTGNTNGLILETLYYKARGSQPLILK